MPNKRRLTAPRQTRTFDELFAELNLSRDERAALVWRLAAMRAQRTVEALMNEPAPDMRVLRSETILRGSR
jgi:hypothetical protein